jgi:hypothetical protein
MARWFSTPALLSLDQEGFIGVPSEASLLFEHFLEATIHIRVKRLNFLGAR